MKIFSERLRELRIENKLSMKALAKQIGASDVAINNWENQINEPKISYLYKLAKFFNVSSDYLIGLEND
jgi:transcriptional regulator with XRE-family HTH domain